MGDTVDDCMKAALDCSKNKGGKNDKAIKGMIGNWMKRLSESGPSSQFRCDETILA